MMSVTVFLSTAFEIPNSSPSVISRTVRRMISVSLGAGAAVLIGAAALTPAHASPGPAIAESNSAPNIAVQGPHNSLKFYWARNGTATWHAETVAGPGSAFSAPSIAETSAGVNIAVRGPHNSLKFYWALNGTATWHAETVAGRGTTFSAPSIAVTSAGANIAVQGPHNSLKFYWVLTGHGNWHA